MSRYIILYLRTHAATREGIGFFWTFIGRCRPGTIDPNKRPQSRAKMCDVWLGGGMGGVLLYYYMPHMFNNSNNNKIIYYTTAARCDVDHTLTNKSTVRWCEKSVFLHITEATIYAFTYQKKTTQIIFWGKK